MKKIVQFSILVIAALVICYTQMPVIAYGFLGFPLMIAALTFLWIILNLRVIPQVTNEMQALQLLTKMAVPKWILIGLLFYMTVVPFVTSWSLFRWNDYRGMIGNVEIVPNAKTSPTTWHPSP